MNRFMSLLCVPLLAASGVAMAGSFQVQPVRLDLTSSQTTAVLHVSNDSNSSVVVQVRLKKWSQSAGKDVLSATRQVLATPPIFSVPAGGQQVVRVGLLSPLKGDREGSYRIFLTQVPPKPKPGMRGLQFTLRVSIPIFVMPSIKGGKQLKPHLNWTCKAAGPHMFRISVSNLGAVHGQIWHVAVSRKGTKKILLRPKLGNGYLLAGAKREWTLKSKIAIKNCQQLMIEGQTAQGEFHVQPGNNP